MRLALLVARREYVTVLRSKGFLFATFGVPLMALLLVTVVFEAIDGAGPASTFLPGETGYVDLAGVIRQPEPFRPFEAESLARAAWGEGQLDSWFLIPADYLDSGSVTLYTRLADSEALEDSMAAFLRENLALQAGSRLPPARLAQPVELRIRASGMDLGAGDAGGAFMVQFLYALGFFVAMQTTSGYLISSLVEEKGSRVLEILITSISPWQLMLGKNPWPGLRRPDATRRLAGRRPCRARPGAGIAGQRRLRTASGYPADHLCLLPAQLFPERHHFRQYRFHQRQ